MADFSEGSKPIPPKVPPAAAAPTKHFTFLLLDGFSLLSYATSKETLRIANRAAGWQAFSWTTVSQDGRPVASSGGDMTYPDGATCDLDRRSVLVICGGDGVESASNSRILGWIRNQAAYGCHVSGLCTAAWTLAEAGLLSSSRATIHWENQDSFGEKFPDIEISGTPVVIDGSCSTTAGGTSAIDLMLEFVADHLGRDIAVSTSERMLYAAIHSLQAASKITAPHRLGLRNEKLRRAIALMDQNLDEDVGMEVIAQKLSISVRQLERLFCVHLKQSPKKYLTGMRLDRARRLLTQTEMSVIEVAIACGFQTGSHFSKIFRRRFDQSPNDLRCGHKFSVGRHVY